ncbi:ABC transporter substrate-binding protein [Pseudomonas sp. NPDC088429]|uniref:ABC transporter substrate-binding protein n=1 Tax=Pseudomonas sp. NPDC088429 TaxID=3364455 RepID=UPI0037F48502
MKFENNNKSSVKPWVLATFSIAASAISFSSWAASNSVEVMHQWTSPSESAAMKVLRDAVETNGLVWQDAAVSGDGGKNMTQTLQSRFAAGNPPLASQAQAQFVLEYTEAGALADLTAQDKAGGWNKLISPELYKYMNSNGKTVAVPLNQRRENMLWINKKVLDQYGGKVPTNWDEFLVLGAKMKAGGIIPLAMGGDDWQEAEVWTNVLIGQAGVDFYKKAIIETDKAALSSPEMVKVFETYRKVLQLSDPNRAGLDWAIATGKVIRGEAAMQFQGDWANGEFAAAGLKPGVDYLCTAAPGHGHTYVFLTDFLAFFKHEDDVQKNQATLANLAMSKEVQENLNLKGGSIPARLDVPRDKFNECSKQAFADRDESIKDGSLIPSFVENTALSRDLRGPIIDVITHFANDPKMTAEQAVKKLAEGLDL